jgi:hypothetical protein
MVGICVRSIWPGDPSLVFHTSICRATMREALFRRCRGPDTLTESRLSWRPLYPSLATAFLTRSRIDFPTRLHWLLYRRKSCAVACGTFTLRRVRGWLFHCNLSMQSNSGRAYFAFLKEHHWLRSVPSHCKKFARCGRHDHKGASLDAAARPTAGRPPPTPSRAASKLLRGGAGSWLGGLGRPISHSSAGRVLLL